MTSALPNLIQLAIAACSPPDRRPIHEWAADHVELLPPLTITGKFRVERSRHFIPIFEALQDDRVRSVNILKPTGAGGTLCAEIWLPWIIANDPGPFLFLLQTDKIADEEAEARIMPILEHCAPVAALFPRAEQRHKKRSNEIIFNNRMGLYVCGPSLSNLQTKRVRYAVLDEVWLYERGIITEAEGRIADYLKAGLSKFVCISQGGTVEDDWHSRYTAGEIHEWQVQCQGCEKFLIPKWNAFRPDRSRHGIVWDEHKTASGFWDIAATVPGVRYVCEHCGHVHLDSPGLKEAWNRTGRFISTSPANVESKSFRLSGIADYPWAELLKIYLHARNMDRMGIKIDTIQFFQKRIPDFYNPDATTDFELITPTEITSAEGKFWDKQDFIFLAVDVQMDHFWAGVFAFSKAGEVMVLWADKLLTWEEIADKQAEFRVPNRGVFVDARHRQFDVYAQCTLHGKVVVTNRGGEWHCWHAMKGSDRTEFIHLIKSGPRKGAKDRLPYTWPPTPMDPCLGMKSDDPLKPTLRGKRCLQFYWSNPWVFDLAAHYRSKFGTGERAFVGPGVSENFSRHLASIRKKEESDKYGNVKWKWDNGGQPDHLWDCFCMALTGACIAKIIGEPTA